MTIKTISTGSYIIENGKRYGVSLDGRKLRLSVDECRMILAGGAFQL